MVKFKARGGETMLVNLLKDQWICSCGNWVDEALEWCPDCCEDKLAYLYRGRRQEEAVVGL
jgi:hypothetical protein